MQFSTHDQEVDLIVVGGGLAGLTAATLVARAGRSVIVLERASELGGRAITHVEHDIHFNLGPHPLYCRGRAFRVFQDLGIPFTGGFPRSKGSVLVAGKTTFPLPRGAGGLLWSRLFTVREKLNLVKILGTLRRLDTRRLDSLPLDEWIVQTAGHGNPEKFLRTLFRVSTYSEDAGACRPGPRSTSSGSRWRERLVSGRRLADARERAARPRHGAGCRTANPHASDLDSERWRVHTTAARQRRDDASPHGRAGDRSAGSGRLARPARGRSPRRLVNQSHPRPGRVSRHRSQPAAAPRLLRRIRTGPPAVFLGAFGVGRARPRNVAVVHVMKNLRHDSETNHEADLAELEGFLDQLQPDWRDLVVARRFLPGMTVVPSLPIAEQGGLRARPDVVLPGFPNIFLAGDWVGREGMLADASAASASEAAGCVLAALSRSSVGLEGSLTHGSS